MQKLTNSHKVIVIVIVAILTMLVPSMAAFASASYDLSQITSHSSFTSAVTTVTGNRIIQNANSGYAFWVEFSGDCESEAGVTAEAGWAGDPTTIFENETTGTELYNVFSPDLVGQTGPVKLTIGNITARIEFPFVDHIEYMEFNNIIISGCKVTVVPPEDGGNNTVTYGCEDIRGGDLYWVNGAGEPEFVMTMGNIVLNETSTNVGDNFLVIHTDGTQTEFTVSDLINGGCIIKDEAGNGETEDIIYGETSHYLLDGAVFHDMPVGKDCLVFAGLVQVGYFSVQNDGTLYAHANERLAKKADWRVITCRTRIKMQTPEPLPVPEFSADPCEGPECPAAKCGLTEDHFIWNSAAGLYIGIKNGAPLWFTTFEAAENAGLEFAGSECSACGYRWQVQLREDGVYVFFALNFTIEDTANELARMGFLNSVELATSASDQWEADGNPLGGWYKVA